MAWKLWIHWPQYIDYRPGELYYRVWHREGPDSASQSCRTPTSCLVGTRHTCIHMISKHVAMCLKKNKISLYMLIKIASWNSGAHKNPSTLNSQILKFQWICFLLRVLPTAHYSCWANGEQINLFFIFWKVSHY